MPNHLLIKIPHYSNPRIICEFLTFSPNSRGGLGWGKKFTAPDKDCYITQNNLYRCFYQKQK